MNNRVKLLRLIVLLGVLAGLFFVYQFYTVFFQNNTRFDAPEQEVFIYPNTTFNELQAQLVPLLQSTASFALAAEKKGYAQRVKSGKYRIPKGSSNTAIITILRSKSQTVDVRFNNQERIENLAGQLAKQLAADSTAFLKAFLDPDFLAAKGFTADNALSMYLPNTYNFFWDVSPEAFRDRMWTAYQRFWNDSRTAKAKSIGLTPLEVSSLAAIVQKETVQAEERPVVAGVYLNRIRKRMRLQADPTVIYALKKQYNNFDTIIKRVLYKDLRIKSPYNTYRNRGVPPGPITMPDLQSIDAVLNSKKHRWLYFVADPQRPGYHAFAVDLLQHNRNKKKYVRWINAKKIYR